MYRVLVDRRIKKQIQSLHPDDQKKVINALDSLADKFSKPKPTIQIKKLKGEPDAWRMRVGNIRVLFYQHKAKQQLEVYKIGYRGEVY